MYGEALYKPEMKEGNPIRLYSLDEITEIFGKLGLRICNSFADFSGKPSSDNDIQLMVYSILHIPQELRIRSRGTERHSASN